MAKRGGLAGGKDGEDVSHLYVPGHLYVPALLIICSLLVTWSIPVSGPGPQAVPPLQLIRLPLISCTCPLLSQGLKLNPIHHYQKLQCPASLKSGSSLPGLAGRLSVIVYYACTWNCIGYISYHNANELQCGVIRRPPANGM